jgi:excisionase family DNA binding protein
MNETNYFTVRQVAVKLGFSEKTLRNWIDSGRLAAVRVGPHSLRIPESALTSLLSRSK